MAVDYRLLLKKYVAFVVKCEGTSFIDDVEYGQHVVNTRGGDTTMDPLDLTPEEFAVLKQIEAEVGT